MLDYVSARLAASEVGKDFLEQREGQQEGDAGALLGGGGVGGGNHKHSEMEETYPSFLGIAWGAAISQSGNGYPLYTRDNHVVYPCPRWFGRSRLIFLCPGDA